MMLVVQLVIMAALGTACALIASSRGRSPVGWFFIGALPCWLGIFGLIMVLVLPDLKVQEERERRLADENRRLREKLRKDRMVADERHAEMNRRIGAHDVALGVDTAGAPVGALPDASPSPAASASPPPSLSPFADQHREASWFWARGTNRDGPIPFGDLQSHWRTGNVTSQTLVWKKGMTQWASVGDVPGLVETLDV
jgi:hypothetical protein